MASMRPAHLHVRLTHPGFATLTTQLFFAEDPHLHSDPAEAVRPGLVMELERRADRADLAARGLLRPYFACRFGFVLASSGTRSSLMPNRSREAARRSPSLARLVPWGSSCGPVPSRRRGYRLWSPKPTSASQGPSASTPRTMWSNSGLTAPPSPKTPAAR